LKKDFYIAIQNEIFEGFSRFDFKGQAVFFRHFNFKDQEILSSCFEKYHAKAISRGIQEESDVLKKLKEDDTWTDDDEISIKEKESYIDSLEKTKGKIVLPSQREAHQDLINQEKLKLYELRIKRKELIGKTATEYANNRANEDFLRNLLYSDSSLSKILFSDQDFEEIDPEDLQFLTNQYHKKMDQLNDMAIQKMVLEDQFSLYLSHCEKPFDFFGKPLINLSVFQLKTIAYGRMFLNIFQNVDKIPDSIRKDPDALVAFAESSRNKQKLTNRDKDNSATAVFGAKKEDLEFVDPEAKQVSLSDLLKKNGGQLNMEQMMEVMGQKV